MEIRFLFCLHHARRPATTRSHQARQFSFAFSTGGSGASDSAQYPTWRNRYFQLAMRRGRKVAKVAMANRLAVKLLWMWRKGWDYEQVRKFGSHVHLNLRFLWKER